MPETITEKTYPIQLLWTLPSLIIVSLFFLVGLSAGSLWFCFIAVAIYLPAYLAIKNFHYSLEKEFVTIKQGILSKKERQLPYGVIQDVVVGQKFVERLFGLANVTFENASQTGSAPAKLFGMTVGTLGGGRRRSLYQEIGIQPDGKVNIPGLKKADAEALKNSLLAKIQANPIKEQGM